MAVREADYGSPLPDRYQLSHGPSGVRQEVLIETLAALAQAAGDDAARPTAGRYHELARQNLARWAQQAPPPPIAMRVLVLPGDWGEVTHRLTKEYGVTFASLNMANAFGPGGGYTHGMVAQEENMFRRTDCHFSLVRGRDTDPFGDRYLPHMTERLNACAEDGFVYLDTESPRVCVRGPEDRSRPDLGYEWLTEDEVFPFFELRAAAVDLRRGLRFDEEETARRVGAQLDTLINAGVRHAVLSAFGCGAFLNPAGPVAAIYRRELGRRARHFDVVAFGIFNAGYGPDNFTPFEATFEDWPDGAEVDDGAGDGAGDAGCAGAGGDEGAETKGAPPPPASPGAPAAGEGVHG